MSQSAPAATPTYTHSCAQHLSLLRSFVLQLLHTCLGIFNVFSKWFFLSSVFFLPNNMTFLQGRPTDHNSAGTFREITESESAEREKNVNCHGDLCRMQILR